MSGLDPEDRQVGNFISYPRLGGMIAVEDSQNMVGSRRWNLGYNCTLCSKKEVKGESVYSLIKGAYSSRPYSQSLEIC